MAIEAVVPRSPLARLAHRGALVLGVVTLVLSIAFVLNGTDDGWRTPQAVSPMQ